MNAQTKAALAAVTERVERLQYQHDSLGVKSIKGVYTYSRGDASIHLEGCKQTIKEVLAILRDIAAGGEVPTTGEKEGTTPRRVSPNGLGTPNPAASETKPKTLFYCDKPACFAHYIANYKIKEPARLPSHMKVGTLAASKRGGV